ncbi:MAG: D-alanine--D-alanine ligase family protein [Rectinema sp.]|jgi:D-alanine-D-alanine ligase|nr:D-alanine--D-alanine ligase family protein [Rectinema sp.]
MKSIAVLYGGRSGEHEVSLISASSILAYLDKDKYSIVPIGITKRGEWFLQHPPEWAHSRPENGQMRSLPPVERSERVLAVPGEGLWLETTTKGLQKLNIDVVFPVLHGTFGEDGTIQGLLETVDLPYVGADVLGSAVGMDKEVSKRLWLSAGLPVVDYISVRKEDVSDENLKILARKVETRFGWPCFVKPACSGSSVGTSKVTHSEELKDAILSALRWSEHALIEAFINAREIECAVLGNERPMVFPPGEIVPSHEFYDYEAKYKDPQGATLLIPAPLLEETKNRIMSLALSAYKYASVKGMARVDFFVEKITGEVFLNEINTIPGFTAISMYPRMCIDAGVSYSELLDKLLELAIEQYAIKRELEYDFSKA